MFKHLKKGAANLLEIVVIVVIVGAITTLVTDSTTNSIFIADDAAQQAIKIERQGGNSTYTDPVVEDPSEGHETTLCVHQWYIENSEILSAYIKKEYRRCALCGDTEVVDVSGTFKIEVPYATSNTDYTAPAGTAKTFTVGGEYEALACQYDTLYEVKYLANFATGTPNGGTFRISANGKSVDVPLVQSSNTLAVTKKFVIARTNQGKILANENDAVCIDLTTGSQPSVPTAQFFMYISAANASSTYKFNIDQFEIFILTGVHTHQFSNDIITKFPSCTEVGDKVRYCTVSGCEYYERESIPMLIHNFIELSDGGATCQEEGYVLVKCAICGTPDAENSGWRLLPHDYKYDVIKLDADYENHIHMRKRTVAICTMCGDVGVDKTEEFCEWEVVVNAGNCTTRYSETKTCKVCGLSVDVYGDYVHLNVVPKTVVSTCSSKGYEQLNCTDCGQMVGSYNEYDYIPHSYTYEATPHDELFQEFKYVCSFCGRVFISDVYRDISYFGYE